MSTIGILITLGRNVKAKELGPYSAALPPIYATYGGEYIAIGGPGRGVTALAGSPERSMMVARFPSLDLVREFWYSPVYRRAVPLREGLGDFDVFGLSGRTIASNATTLCAVFYRDQSLDFPFEPFADSRDGIELLEGERPPCNIALFAVTPSQAPVLEPWAAVNAERAYVAAVRSEKESLIT